MRISKEKVLTGTAATIMGLVLSGGVAFAQTYSSGTSSSRTGTLTSGTSSLSGTSSSVMTNATNSRSSATSTGIPNTGVRSSTGTTSSSTPGIPNTGAGGTATTNLQMLLAAALATIGGTVYLWRNRRAVR